MHPHIVKDEGQSICNHLFNLGMLIEHLLCAWYYIIESKLDLAFREHLLFWEETQ